MIAEGENTLDGIGLAVLILPPSPCPRDYLMRAISWFRQRFDGALKHRIMATADVLDDHRGQLPGTDINSYEREHGDAVVFMTSPDITLGLGYERIDRLICERKELFADDLTKIEAQHVYVMLHGFLLRRVNHVTSTTDYPHLQSHRFMQLSSADPNEFYFLFPFGALQRESGVDMLNELGCRIRADLAHLSNRSSGHRVVAVFGGEAAYCPDCLHNEMWSVKLEAELNKWGADRDEHLHFTVLNFAQPGMVALNSITLFLTFCHRLRPDFVIAHNGKEDLFFGAHSDPWLLDQFQISYPEFFETWARRLHQHPAAGQCELPPNSPNIVLRAYARRQLQFREIVEAQGGSFVWGLEPLPDELAESQLSGVDICHHAADPGTGRDRANMLIANEYARVIVSLLNQCPEASR